ncbi:MAG: polysaccharide biosynthesis/export family protein [Bacteroidales bacterium]|nr:polysaccharide biosynthesis/export family protein [Bacteroidales bacterium]
MMKTTIDMKRFGLAVLVLAAVIAASSCASKTYKEINYLQDIQRDTILPLNTSEGIKVQPKDMISIVVSGSNPRLAAQFNLVNVSYQAGSESQTSGSYNRLMGYSVATDGTIDFPVLGKVQVAGLNRWEVADLIKTELSGRGLLSDPVVIVEFLNFKISVLGEVSHPGTYTVSGDRINILEALSLAGDLTIFGRRECVKVSREQDGVRKVFVVDLRNSDALLNEEAYYLQQNDVIYVTPNSVRAGQSKINENNFRSVSFWVSISSVLVSTANLIVTIASKVK